MAILRSRRLEALLGARVDQLAESNIAGLVAAQVPEDSDLDYKSVLYGNSDSNRRDLAGDVAALANAAGGILILGIAEDEHARATATPGVALSDAEDRRMTQIVAGLTVPMPQFSVLPVPSMADTAHGWYVIAVARSPLAPHAVTVNDGLRYPVRNGTNTRYLTEPEVAAAYRLRGLGDRHLTERLKSADQTGRLSLDPGIPWIYVTVTPELRGDMPMTRDVYEAFRARHQAKSSIFDHNLHFMKFGVGRNRWSTHGGTNWGDGSARWVSMDLHADGTVFFARQLWDIRNGQAVPDDVDVISDELIVATVVEALVRFGRHVQESRAGGQAAIIATLAPAHDHQIAIGNRRSFGFGQSASTVMEDEDVITSVAYGETDDFSLPGPGLMQVVRQLSTELGQSFGIVDSGLINESGELVTAMWSGGAQSPIVLWARSQPNMRTV